MVPLLQVIILLVYVSAFVHHLFNIFTDQFFVSHMPEVNAAWRMWKHTYQCARDGSGGTRGKPGKACTSLCSLL